jgi:TDG/mug DNA glycosylase family protein
MKEAMPPIVDDQTAILILGSMPGEKSLSHQQYYANRGNHFWKLMFSVFGMEFTFDYSARLQLLKEQRIGLWDVLAYCEREGSLDSNIKNEAANDFGLFIAKHPTIRHIVFSSKAAEKYYFKYSKSFDGITYHVLPSPSGANAGKTFAEKLEVWQILVRL